MVMEYDVLFFEALGEEKHHLAEVLANSQAAGKLPKTLRWYIGTETLHEFTTNNPGIPLPDILSTKTHSRLPESWLHSGSKKSVISRSAGYDHFEHLAQQANITSLREYCVNAVAETAVKLMFAVCGNLNQYTHNTAVFEWDKCISFKELTGLKAAVFGVGRIGKRIYDMLAGLGLDVRGVDTRAQELSQEYGGSVRFVSPQEATDSHIVICAMNYTKEPSSRFYNKNYFTEAYLRQFPQGFVFVNVTRGEIAPEAPLLALYREGRLFGIGLDVFGGEAGVTQVLRGAKEPQSADEAAAVAIIRSALDRSENFYVQAHQGFNSDKAALCKAEETVRHLEHYYAHGCFASQLPYYL
jgi:D-lactate dehydrogenase